MGDAASKGIGPTHIHAFIHCNLFVVGKENGWAIPPTLHLPQQPQLTASPCFASPNQRDAWSFGSELAQTATAVCSGNIRDVLMPEQGKLPLSLIPTGYSIRDNEDRTGSARLASKQMWGLLSQQRFSKPCLKIYPRDSLSCQDLPNMFCCQITMEQEEYLWPENSPQTFWKSTDLPLLLNSVHLY